MKENQFDSCQRKRRHLNYSLLRIRMFLFLFSFCLLPDKILSEATTSIIKLKIEGNASSQLIKPDFGQEPSKVFVNGQEKPGCQKNMCFRG